MTAAEVWFHALPGLISILLLGSGITLLLWRGPERISFWEWLGWSWLAGSGVGSMLLGGLGLLLRGGWLFSVMAATALSVAAAGWRWRGTTPAPWPVAAARWEKCLLAVPLALVAVALAGALRHTLLADGLFLVEFKARVAFLNGGRLPGGLFTDATRVSLHPSYPLLSSLGELWLYGGAGKMDQAVASTFLAPFYASGVFLLYGFVARTTGPLWAGTLAAALTAGVPQLLLDSFTLQFGYADYPLAVIFAAGVMALLLPARQLPLAALAFALLPWTKTEGVLLWALCAAATGWSMGLLRWKTTILVTAPGAVVFLGWHVVLRLVHAQAEHVFAPVNLLSLGLALRRLGPVASYFLHELANVGPWGLLWWSLPLAAAVGWHTPQRERVVLAAALSGGALGLDLLPYLFTQLDLSFHLRTSCDRLVLQSAWVALLPLALALGAFGARREAAPAPAVHVPSPAA